MAFTEFCCRSGGSNLNAGTRTGNSTEPGTSADLTYASGNWVQSTGVFTVASGNPASDGVAVGDFASVYANGSSVTGFVGRVTARDATTITISLTAKAGTAPADGTGDRTLKIGGAWAGPSGADIFPFGFIQNTLTDASSNPTRINFKNAATFSVTASCVHNVAGPTIWRGYATAYGDGGRALFDGGTSGAAYTVISFGLSSGQLNLVEDLEIAHNGATSTANGFNHSGGAQLRRVVVRDIRGNGINGSSNGLRATECEAYACSGVGINGNGGTALRCIAHDNTGIGFSFSGGGMLSKCIADTNGGVGFSIVSGGYVFDCEAYSNTGNGLTLSNSGVFHVENSNFIKNGGYGIQGTGTTPKEGTIVNCGFGAGTQANTSGPTNSLSAVDEIGSVTYPNDVTPWVDPANGDFRINHAAAKGAGRGAFLQTASSYAGTVGYPDIGAAQHLEGNKAIGHGNMTGGLQ